MTMPSPLALPPEYLRLLDAAADDTEVAAIDADAERAGLIWVCRERAYGVAFGPCNRINAGEHDCCGSCGRERAAVGRLDG